MVNPCDDRMIGFRRSLVALAVQAGYELPINSLSRMKMFGVSPEFIETMR